MAASLASSHATSPRSGAGAGANASSTSLAATTRGGGEERAGDRSTGRARSSGGDAGAAGGSSSSGKVERKIRHKSSRRLVADTQQLISRFIEDITPTTRTPATPPPRRSSAMQHAAATTAATTTTTTPSIIPAAIDVASNSTSADVEKTPTATTEAAAVSAPAPAPAPAPAATTAPAATPDTSVTTPQTSPEKSRARGGSNTSVLPASIPIRTSSSRVLLNSEYNNGSISPPSSAHRTPHHHSHKHRSHGSGSDFVPTSPLPEVTEREWMSPGHRAAAQMSPPHAGGPAYAGNGGGAGYADGNEPSRREGGGGGGGGADLINGDLPTWTAEKENILRGPYDYLESTPGKDIRSQLIAAFNAWLAVPPASLAVITRVVAMLHTASLLIDDVEDSSLLRRGKPVAHSIFGTAQTINSANYIYFCALQELAQLGNPEVVRIYTDELLNLHRGQGMDLFWRDTLTCPTEDDYLEMVGNKTGGLFRLAIKLMCAESPSHNYPPFLSRPSSTGDYAAEQPQSSSAAAAAGLQQPQRVDYIPLVNTIGLLFQILDDYRNLSDGLYTANKGLCEDLTEGKFSFPIIHAIRADPANLVLLNILKQRTTDDDVKRYAVSYMETRTGSFAYTRRVLRGLTKKALALIDEVDRAVALAAAGSSSGAVAAAGEQLPASTKSEAIKAILERLRVDKAKDRASMPETGSAGMPRV